MERAAGLVHPHEPALAILDEEVDVGQRVEEREHLLGGELGGIVGSGRPLHAS